MKLSFRQGIARYQTDVLHTPTFLQKSAGDGSFIDLVVSPDPTIVAFAHRSANYIVEEVKTIPRAWGPFTTSQTVYLYWDINLLTAEITRGSTIQPPIFAAVPPSVPAVDQHWFDSNDTVMRVWNGQKWIEKIRVFAAFLQSGTIIRPYPIGSQAGIVGEFEGGNLVLDAYNKPLRQSDGSFVTSVTSLIIVNNSAKKVKFEAEVLSGMAAEPVPMYSLVQIRPGRRIVLARSNDYMSRVAGIITEDLYTNEVGFITTEGLIRNESWNWPASMVNRPVFCGTNGEITTTPPHSGVLQVAGFVYDTDSIYMNIFSPIILDDVWGTAQPPVPAPPPPAAPIADFYSAITSGDAPLTVTFTSTSLHSPTSFEWDFTGDGVVDAVTPTAQYTYATPGTYTVKLRAVNGFGFDDEVKTGYITVTLAPATGAYTNLSIQIGGPGQVSRASTFQISVNVTNEGHLTATNVVRRITLPDVNGQQVIPSGLPAGAVVSRNTERTVIDFPPIATLSTGLNYGPVFFNLTSPGKQGNIKVFAEVNSPEVDGTIGNNTAVMVIGIQP